MYFIFQVQHEFICYNCELMFMFTCLLINDYSDHLKITVAFMLWKSLRYMSWTLYMWYMEFVYECCIDFRLCAIYNFRQSLTCKLI